MPFPPPVLDPRTAEPLLERMSQLLRERVPTWQGDWRKNPDAAVMLHRLFARLHEITLERLNRVPEKSFFAFLNALGIDQLPATPARALLTFALSKGSPAVVVPRGTPAGTAPGGHAQPIEFETLADLTVVPARLVAAYTVDPGWDRWTDLGARIDGRSGDAFTPFVGARRLPHELWLGQSDLLDFAHATVDVSAPMGTGGEALARLEWHAGADEVESGTSRPIAVEPWADDRRGRFAARLRDLNGIAPRTLRGVSESAEIRQGANDRWLIGRLPTTLVGTAVHALPTEAALRQLLITVSANDLLPDAAFGSGGAVDVHQDFFPFGEVPRTGDTFHLASREALGKPGVRLTLSVRARRQPAPGPDAPLPVLQWEWLGAGGWVDLPVEQDGTAGLTTDGDLTFAPLPSPGPILAKVGGQEGYWIRARIAAGDFGKPVAYVLGKGEETPPEVVPETDAPSAEEPSEATFAPPFFEVAPGTGTLSAPVVSRLRLAYTASAAPGRIVTRNGMLWSDLTASTRAGTPSGIPPFLDVRKLQPEAFADPRPTFHLGFDAVAPEEAMTFYVALEPPSHSGAGAPPPGELPLPSRVPRAIRWQYFNGRDWAGLAVVDLTQHFTQSGTLEILTPRDMAPLARLDSRALYWIRAVLEAAPDGAEADDPVTTPRLTGIHLNTVPAAQWVTVADEVFGSGTGLPDQRFRLAQSPILEAPAISVREPEPPSAAERERLEAEEGADAIRSVVNPVTGGTEIWVRWHQVPDFNASTPSSRHYTLRHETGEVQFGDGRRGQVPPPGGHNLAATYRVGGGARGNVAASAVALIRSPIPGIAGVTNPVAADGGADAESLDEVLRRGPQRIRNRGRAVSREDFEWRAREAVGSRLARVTCLPNVNRSFAPEPGWVTLVIVPNGGGSRPQPSAELIREVEDALRPACYAGLAQAGAPRLNVICPGYLDVAVVAEIVPRVLRDGPEAKRRVVEALERFLHPLTGGPEGGGWSFGRPVFVSEICRVIEEVPGVDHLTRIELVPDQIQRRLHLAESFIPDQTVPAGSWVRSAHGGKFAFLAERLMPGTVVSRLSVRGFKVGDRVLRHMDAGRREAWNPPLSVRAVGWDPTGARAWLDVAPADLEADLRAGDRLSTVHRTVVLPIVAADDAARAAGIGTRRIWLNDLGESLEALGILRADGVSFGAGSRVDRTEPLPDVFLDDHFLPSSGRHQITLRTTPAD